MISMALQRDVPQYIAIPWFITNVMARTISVDHGMNSIHVTLRNNLRQLIEAHRNNSKHLKLTFHRTVDVVSVGKNNVHIF